MTGRSTVTGLAYPRERERERLGDFTPETIGRDSERAQPLREDFITVL